MHNIVANEMNKLQLGKSYMIEYATVKSFNSIKYLSTPKIGFSVTLVHDIGDVQELQDEPTDNIVTNAVVLGVECINHHKSCIKCQGKVDDLDGIIGTCSKCAMMQRIDRCTTKLSSKLFICSTDSGATEYHMTAFRVNMQQITQDIEDMSDTDITTQLLMSDPFTFTFSAM